MKTSPFSFHLNFLYFWPSSIFFLLFFIPYYCLMNTRRPSPLINPWRTDLLPQHTCSVWISRLIEAILSFSWAVSPINHMLGLDQISGVWTIRIRSDQFRTESGIYCAFRPPPPLLLRFILSPTNKFPAVCKITAICWCCCCLPCIHCSNWTLVVEEMLAFCN